MTSVSNTDPSQAVRSASARLPIGRWPEREHPRERLLGLGLGSLTDTELLAIILRTGVRGATALDVARAALAHHGGVSALLKTADAEPSCAPGFGPSKVAQVRAGIALARRALREEVRQGAAFKQPQAVRDYLRLSLGALAHEVFVVLFLDSQRRLLAAAEMFRGTLAQTSVSPRPRCVRAPP